MTSSVHGACASSSARANPCGSRNADFNPRQLANAEQSRGGHCNRGATSYKNDPSTQNADCQTRRPPLSTPHNCGSDITAAHQGHCGVQSPYNTCGGGCPATTQLPTCLSELNQCSTQLNQYLLNSASSSHGCGHYTSDIEEVNGLLNDVRSSLHRISGQFRERVTEDYDTSGSTQHAQDLVGQLQQQMTLFGEKISSFMREIDHDRAPDLHLTLTGMYDTLSTLNSLFGRLQDRD